MNDKLPKNVALGELYAKYSLFDAHAGNSLCCTASASSSSSRFHGNWVSVTVGVVTRVSPEWIFIELTDFMNEQFLYAIEKKQMEKMYLLILATVFYCRYHYFQYCRHRCTLRLNQKEKAIEQWNSFQNFCTQPHWKNCVARFRHSQLRTNFSGKLFACKFCFMHSWMSEWELNYVNRNWCDIVKWEYLK